MTPAGNVAGRLTVSVVPLSTSEALAKALRVELAPSSIALPVTAPLTTGASLVPVMFTTMS